MDANLKTKWIEALRSGEYRQAFTALKKDDGFCCLGVLCKVAGYDIGGDYGNQVIIDGEEVGYRPLREIVGDEESLQQLYYRNDGLELDGVPFEKHSFSEIADYIEANIPADPVPAVSTRDHAK